MKRKFIALMLAICLLLSGCTAQTYAPPDYSAHKNEDETDYRTVLVDVETLKEGQPVLALHEEEANLTRKFSGVKDETWGYDLRSCDATSFDFGAISNFSDISFSTDTIWPAELPDGFSPQEILEFNKNPGLGIRALHEQGITGVGVGIAIIDQALLPGHEQYRDNLMLYERIHCRDGFAQMHGGAVSSIAVGKDIGVAPNAKLYYIAETNGHGLGGESVFDASILADCILRVLEVNRHLPKEQKIRVISISKGYNKNDVGYHELAAAIKQADKDGIFVITTSTNEFYGFALGGLGRDYWADPNDIHSYAPSIWYEDGYYANPELFRDFLLVPMDSRTLAGYTGNNDYQISKTGGLSWAVPWLAGFYALCCQVKPDLTPTEFIAAVKDVAVTTEIEHDGTTYPFGNIVNPAATIEILQKK